MLRSLIALSLVLLLGVPWFAFADSGPHLDSSFVVPKRYQSDQASATDHTAADMPFVRYSHAYEAFWWNCVAIKAKSLGNRCPFNASGWPAEVAGASDGASKAANGIADLIKKYDAATVQTYLNKLASPSIVKAKLAGRFDKPTADPDGF